METGSLIKPLKLFEVSDDVMDQKLAHVKSQIIITTKLVKFNKEVKVLFWWFRNESLRLLTSNETSCLSASVMKEDILIW